MSLKLSPPEERHSLGHGFGFPRPMKRTDVSLSFFKDMEKSYREV